MRAYFFVNSALSGIQKGLQVAHCAVEMAHHADQFSQGQTAAKAYHDWAINHKTIIVLEGGNHRALLEISDFLSDIIHHNPWAEFREDNDTLSDSYTAVGVVLPERIYEAAKVLRESRVDMDRWMKIDPAHPHFGRKVRLEKLEEFTEWEAELIKLLNSCPMAR